MKKALYGHLGAGELWADKLAKVVKDEGFKPVTGWLSMYIKHTAGELPQVIGVYVDDLFMLGPREALGRTRRRVRKIVDMEDPHEFGKLLGCYHRLSETTCPRVGGG